VSTPSLPQVPPSTFRAAGVLVALEGFIALVAAVVLVVRAVNGVQDAVANGYGTAGWFAMIGIIVGAAGIALVLGKRWARAVALVVQLLLLPVVWALLTDSHQPLYGALLGIGVLAILVLLFSPPSSQWMAAEYAHDHGDDAA
jgi:peptidoglycan/LPS O-acetylase OafA/YrhL